MYDYRVILGIIATVISIIGYIPYFIDMFKGKTKPHAFSWLVWGVLTWIGFLAQIQNGGGAGSWVTGVTAVFCLIIFVFALFKGEKNITKSDWISLGMAGVIMVLWFIIELPVLSIVLVAMIDALGIYPTVRKTYLKPYEETLSTYALGGLKWGIGIIALESFSILTVLYPASLVIMNWGFVGMVLVRRKAMLEDGD